MEMHPLMANYKIGVLTMKVMFEFLSLLFNMHFGGFSNVP